MKTWLKYLSVALFSAVIGSVAISVASDIGASDWSETDASNNVASPKGFPEGMAPSGVNDSARAVMGAVKRYFVRLGGTVTTTGTDTVAADYTVNGGAHYTGDRYLVKLGGTNTGTATFNPDALGAKTIKDQFGIALSARALLASAYADLIYDGTDMRLVNPLPQVIQRQRGEVATNGSTQVVIPLDDTIPQNTEGAEIVTIAITPKNTGNKLRVRYGGQFALTVVTSNGGALALFQDATANALHAVYQHFSASSHSEVIYGEYVMTAGTVSATTFKLRGGVQNANDTLAWNGSSGGRIFGGIQTVWIEVEELLQ